MALASMSASRADDPIAGSADVHVMVFPSSMFPPAGGDTAGEDHVTFTYPKEMSEKIAMRDFLAYSKVTSRTLHEVQVSTDRTPLASGQSQRMTCVTFTTPGLVRTGATHFELEPFILSLKEYKHIRLSFIAPPGFSFSGLRTYKDKNVAIRLDPVASGGGTTYTYDVRVLDATFTSLRLPAWQADPATERMTQSRDAERKQLLVKVLGIILIGGVASVIGYYVYSALLAKAPPS
ncbi:MAG TPA: hypothetical protein VGK19_08950 [Capsulimonadaceae bacterium]|jgi:hypothetical protein